ncbi:MAG: SDR family NAD(P)-dependent oxidoreductase [Nitrososphaerales archaeon]
MSLTNRVAIITGASGFIGEAIAKLFAKEGASVVLVARNEKNLNRLASELKKDGKNAVAMQGDITEENEVQNVIEQTRRQFDKIDVLVNNAAVIKDPVPFHTMTDKAIHELVETNLLGTFRMTRAVLPTMMEQKNGVIVNIASVAGMKAVEKVPLAVYDSTKAAVIMFTKSIALEYGQYNVRVNCVCPGTVRGPFLQPYLEDERARQVLNSMQPLGRIGEPEDVARAILYLSSDSSSWVTGAVLVVDGGIMTK